VASAAETSRSIPRSVGLLRNRSFQGPILKLAQVEWAYRTARINDKEGTCCSLSSTSLAFSTVNQKD
jgi:hypothetical protein